MKKLMLDESSNFWLFIGIIITSISVGVLTSAGAGWLVLSMGIILQAIFVTEAEEERE